MFEIIAHPIDTQSVIQKVSSPRAGAIATFIGITRNFTADLSVASLFYEGYEPMALQMMAQIGREVQERFDIEKIAITHRIGQVLVEEASVVIAVSSAHRAAAFDACRYAIDTLKEIVPIWKKEQMTDGSSQWIANH
jgi:molybdopterin synthase catalytic subunit